MITWVTGDKVQQIRGLSSDIKPTNASLKEGIIPNGSVFFEMDTSKIYMFNYDSQTWLEVSNAVIAL